MSLIIPTRREPTHTIGVVENKEAEFDKIKAEVFDKIGTEALNGVHVLMDRVLLAIFIRPPLRGSIIMPDKVRDEDIYQGNSGLVLKLGNRAYEDTDEVQWRPDDRARVGDWVLFHRSQGFRMMLMGVECIMMEHVASIKAVLQYPDVVY